ncbi:MAG TPA: type II CAAX endopeptidase family protein [Anaerolineales bacterium]
MDIQPSNVPLGPHIAAEPAAPWSLRDTWLGVALMILILALLVLVIPLFQGNDSIIIPLMFLAESIYLVPIAVVLLARRVPWRSLGFKRFEWSSLGIGCGLLIATYSLSLIHNLILMRFGISTQGDMISELMQSMSSPGWFVLIGALVAPVVEEMFFRGFLFSGFRQRYGWIGALVLSSALFALAHLDPASLFPTFLMGCVLAFVYHRSGSLWPGIILHCLLNSFALCAIFVTLKFSGILP